MLAVGTGFAACLGMDVSEVMTTNVEVLGPEDTLQTAMGLMYEHECGILPVVNAGRLRGVLTDRDVAVLAFVRDQPLSKLPVSQAMTAVVYTVTPQTSITEAERTMATHRVRRLPVVDESGDLVGLLSLDDLARMGAQRHWTGEDGLEARYLAQTLSEVGGPRRPSRTAYPGL
jgi:CBS domain-containing protein